MFTLIGLTYAPDALEPVISKETIGFHHGKHLAAYVDNLNKLLSGSEYEGMALAEIVRNAPAGAVFNNAGQILNHEMYFAQFKPAGEITQGPKGALAAQDGNLVITQEANAANPIQKGLKPLLTFDVWEHAYYLDYQNRRAAHLAALWQIVDWKVIEKRYE